MDIIINNFEWMSFNILLAFLPILFGWVMYTAKYKSLKIAASLLWILFIPNSIYIFTDIKYLPGDLRLLNETWSVLVTIQYLIFLFIGAITFILGMYPFEKLIAKAKNKSIRHNRLIILISTNLLIGLGIVLGRFQETNSWEVFTNIQKVISDSISVFTSHELLVITLLFGIFSNITYFTLMRIFHTLIPLRNH